MADVRVATGQRQWSETQTENRVSHEFTAKEGLRHTSSFAVVGVVIRIGTVVVKLIIFTAALHLPASYCLDKIQNNKSSKFQ